MNIYDKIWELAGDTSNRELMLLLWISFQVELLRRASRSHAHRLHRLEVKTGVVVPVNLEAPSRAR